jgi:hypothetical protein
VLRLFKGKRCLEDGSEAESRADASQSGVYSSL